MYTHERDNQAFLFNLTHRRHFPVKKRYEGAVEFYHKGYWGFGNLELELYDEPFNQQNGCRSCLYESGYNIGEDADGRNLLTMCSDEEFTISEFEVWALNDDYDNNQSEDVERSIKEFLKYFDSLHSSAK